MEKYEKNRLIGRGAYGSVYLCTRRKDQKKVVFKEIPVDQMSLEERQVSMIEAEVLSILNHPNIVAYHESILDNKTMIIVMEYVQGGTLYDYLKQRNGELLSEEEVLHFFGQMAYTMQYVHSKMILHRDLKSQNIFLDENKYVLKIGDFGISKVLSTKSKAVTVVGTPCYISPELCEGKPYNQKSDIWALGCILYELMTLRKPFEADTLPALVMKIMRGHFDPAPDIYSAGLQSLLSNILNLDPQERPSAAQIMCNPVMMATIFRLYMDIGAIRREKSCPAIKQYCTDTKNLQIPEHQIEICHLQENAIPEMKSNSELWVLYYHLTSIVSLPMPKCYLISLSLNSSHIVGVTDEGHLISWKEIPRIFINEKHSSEISPLYIASTLHDNPAVRFASVACGDKFTICLTDTGMVFSFGEASSKCLGYPTTKDIQLPKVVEELFGFNIISVACGAQHVIAVSNEHEVFSWGFGDSGCLGLGKIEFQCVPKLVTLNSKYRPVKVICGKDSTFILTQESGLLVCGSNRHNKLGLDTGNGNQVDRVKVFTRVQSEPIHSENIVDVSAGESHTAFLNANGRVFTVGSDVSGQLGWENKGLDYSILHQVEKLADTVVKQIACGNSFTIALSEDKKLFCWGKCPKSLMDSDDLTAKDISIPTLFKDKTVQSIICCFDQCIISGNDCTSNGIN